MKNIKQVVQEEPRIQTIAYKLHHVEEHSNHEKQRTYHSRKETKATVLPNKMKQCQTVKYQFMRQSNIQLTFFFLV